MIIGQIGDLHLLEQRLPEQIRCLEYAINTGNKAGVQLWLITGDIFGTKVPYHATELERLTFAKLLKKMGQGEADMVLVRGNHDSDSSLDLYDLLSEPSDMEYGGGFDIHVVTAPRIIRRLSLSIVAFPYPSKRWVVAAEGAQGIETLRVDLGRRLFEILRGLVLSCETDEIVIAGHCSVAGSRTGGGEILAGQEIELTKAELGELFEISGGRLRYIGMGHIHAAQEIIPGAWYAGTPSSYGFDGSNEHGFLIIDTSREPEGDSNYGECHVEFHPTPARRHYTIDVEWQHDETGWHWGDPAIKPQDPGGDIEIMAFRIKGSMVKLRPRIPESQRQAADYTRLVDELRADGATVIIDPCIVPHSRQREVSMLVPTPADVAVRGKASLREGLAQLWQSQKPQPAMAVQARALKVLDGES